MNFKNGVTALFMGMILMVIGLILLGTVIDTAATTGGNANIGSFTGTQDINDLAPLVFAAVVIGAGVALVALAIAGFVGRGPLKGG